MAAASSGVHVSPWIKLSGKRDTRPHWPWGSYPKLHSFSSFSLFYLFHDLDLLVEQNLLSKKYTYKYKQWEKVKIKREDKRRNSPGYPWEFCSQIILPSAPERLQNSYGFLGPWAVKLSTFNIPISSNSLLYSLLSRHLTRQDSSLNPATNSNLRRKQSKSTSYIMEFICFKRLRPKMIALIPLPVSSTKRYQNSWLDSENFLLLSDVCDTNDQTFA